MTHRQFIRRVLTDLMVASLIAGGAVGFAAGCGYGKVACKIIDTAADACTVLRYLDKNGKVQEVRVSKDDLQAFAAETAAKQSATQCDGGCAEDGGAK